MEMCSRVFVCDWRTWLKRIWTEGREVVFFDGYYLGKIYHVFNGGWGAKG